jgi:hypothetical protein
MPDTFTHIAVPALFHRYFGRRLLAPLVLIGTVLPDYLREVVALVLPVQFYAGIYIFHTLAGAVLVALLISGLFEIRQRTMVFLSIFVGELLHFGFDLLQNYMCPGRFYLLFPYSYSFEFGLIPERFWLYIFCISLTTFLTYIIIQLVKRRRVR